MPWDFRSLPEYFHKGHIYCGNLTSAVTRQGRDINGWTLSCLPSESHVMSSCYAGLNSSFLLSERTPLKRCCVHNTFCRQSRGQSSEGRGLPQLHGAKCGYRSSCWSLPVGRYLSDTCCKGLMVVLARWTASNMAEEPQTSISHQVRERWTTSGSSDFRIWHMASIRYPQDLA